MFSMMLSFYLTSIVDNQKNLTHQKSFLTAQLMARMTVTLSKDKTDGEILFNHGTVQFKRLGERLNIVVALKGAGAYQFKLPITKKE